VTSTPKPKGYTTAHSLVPRETLQQVLDALRGSAGPDELNNATETIKTLLDAPSEPKQMTPIQVRDGIADWIDTNINHREFWTPDVVELIRSIEINGQGYTPKEIS
jgi:hypothetical protein